MNQDVRNVILITIDELRADFRSIGKCFGFEYPTFERLVENGTYFSNATSGGTATPFSFPWIICGRSVLPYSRLGLFSHEATISKKMKQIGYKTAAFIAANPYVSKSQGYHNGFDLFNDFMDYDKKKLTYKNLILSKKDITILEGLMLHPRNLLKYLNHYYNNYLTYSPTSCFSGDFLTDQTIKYLKKNITSKNFLWMHYMDVHGPWNPPTSVLPKDMSALEAIYYNIESGYKEDSNHLKKIKSLYAGEIKYVDHVIRKLLDFLEKTNLLEETLLIVTSDHGQEWGEHGMWGHQANPYEELLQVPLIFYGAEIPKGKIITQNVSNGFIPKTVTELVLEKKDNTFPGLNLFNVNEGIDLPPVTTEVCHSGDRRLNFPYTYENLRYDLISYKKNGFKFIWVDVNNTFEIYDLNKDPNERNNIVNNEKVKWIKNELINYISNLRTKREILEIKSSLKKIGAI